MKILSIILILLTGLNGAGTNVCKVVTVDRIEDGIIVLNYDYLNGGREIEVKQEDINKKVVEGEKINVTEAAGRFISITEYKGSLYYQFKSWDNSCFWCLTEKGIGFVPELETEYNLIFYDNGTTKENKTCGCAPDLDCECYVSDDIFLNVERGLL